jgi:hypothetical protein
MAASGTTSDDMPGEARVDPASGGGPRAAGADQPTRSLVAAGDRCSACGAPLASDQRYCLACGERRGKTRFPMAAAAAPAVVPAAASAATRRTHVPSAAALIAGIGTLLLAMGVGVLIGRTNSNNTTPVATRASPVQVITVAGSGSRGSGAPTASRPGRPAKAAAAKTAAASKPKTVIVTKQVAAKASAAAAKVLGGNINTPPTVTMGQSGHGPGFTNGRFTGQFFGP